MKSFYLLILIFLISCSKTTKIIDKPIIFNKQRKQLTLDYLSDRYGLIQEKPIIIPKMIVLHWTYISTFEESFEAFKNETLPKHRASIKSASSLNVSAHFLVDQDGTIYQLMPETMMARHVIGLNHCALGIENVGGDKNHPLTTAQEKANIWLVNYLAEKYQIEYVIGHYQYTNFENHSLWLEKDDGYRTKKDDPGASFLNTVLEANKQHHFKSIPKK